MITFIYRIIIALILVAVGWNMYTEEKLTKQFNCAMVLIPLALRLLMIK